MSDDKTKAEADQEYLGVCVILLNNQNQILLGERVNSFGAGTLGLPGGRINIDEPLMDAAIRELEEETAVRTTSLDYVGVVRDHQKTYNFIHFGFVIEGVTQMPQNSEPDKCKGWSWYSQNELPENILRGHKAVIDMYLASESIKLKDLVS